MLHQCAKAININSVIWNLYFDELLPRFTSEGDDGNYGSTAVCDVLCLQVKPIICYSGNFVNQLCHVGNFLFFKSCLMLQNSQRFGSLLNIKSSQFCWHLQALSKRIHYGKFVAEAKFRDSPKMFEDAIRAKVCFIFSFLWKHVCHQETWSPV